MMYYQMAASWEWIWNVWSDAFNNGTFEGITSTRFVDVPLDANLQRVIYRRGTTGDLQVARDDQLPMPSPGFVEATVYTQYGSGPTTLVYNHRVPLVYVPHWVVSAGLGGTGYWTWTTSDQLGFDMELRRGAAIESAHQLAVNFEESLEFVQIVDPVVRDYPTYRSWTSVGILVSRPV